MLFKKFVAPVVIGAALLGSVASAGVASAAAPAVAAPATAPTGSHQAKTWLKDHRRAVRKAGLAISAKTIGVTAKDLAAELRSGKSIAQVAGEHNVSAQTVVTDLVNAVDAKIDQAVTNHKLTAAQATKIKAAVPARITKVVNHVF